MDTAINILFYGGTALYVMAAVLVFGHLRGTSERPLAAARILSVLGAVCLSCVLALRWAKWDLLPLTSVADALNLFVVLSTFAIIMIVAIDRNAALLSFAIPPLAVACLANAATAHSYLHTAPRDLPSVPLAAHVGLAFLAYSLFFLAAVTSAAYMFQARRLKRHNTSGLFQRLPSLEKLDRSLVRLLAYGYPLFVGTMILGLIWAHVDAEVLSSSWWMSPKVVISFVVAVFYAVTFHMRRAGRLHGEKLAHRILLGFAILLLTYAVLGLANVRTYHFWSASL